MALLDPPTHSAALDSRTTSVTPGLDALLARLDALGSDIPLAELRQALQEADFSRDDLKLYCCFNENTYRRNRVHSGPGYEALVLCWRPEQRSAIHDHRGSACAFRVLEGHGLETVFECTDDGVTPVDSRPLPTGFVCASQDTDIHEVANEGDTDLVTLHIYSPELSDMRTFVCLPPN